MSASTWVSAAAGGVEAAKDIVKLSPARNPTSKLPMAGTQMTQPYSRLGSFAQKVAKPLAVLFTASEVKGILKEDGSAGNKALKISNTITSNVGTFVAASAVVTASDASWVGVSWSLAGGCAVGAIGDNVKSYINNKIDRYVP